jgi:hypothetical protein
LVEDGEAGKYTALKAPRQCPLFLLVKVGWKQGRVIGSEEKACHGRYSRGNKLSVWTVVRTIKLNYF